MVKNKFDQSLTITLIDPLFIFHLNKTYINCNWQHNDEWILDNNKNSKKNVSVPGIGSFIIFTILMFHSIHYIHTNTDTLLDKQNSDDHSFFSIRKLMATMNMTSVKTMYSWPTMMTETRNFLLLHHFFSIALSNKIFLFCLKKKSLFLSGQILAFDNLISFFFLQFIHLSFSLTLQVTRNRYFFHFKMYFFENCWIFWRQDDQMQK